MKTQQKRIFLPLILVFTLLLPVIPGLKHNTACAEKKKIILKQANSLAGGEERSPITGKLETVRSVSGNVVFKHNDILLRCNKATEFSESNLISLEGGLSILSPSFDIRSNRGLYYPLSDTAKLLDNVRGKTQKSGLTFKASKADIDNRNNRIRLITNAVAWHDTQQLSGDTIMVQLSKGKKRVESITVTGRAFLAFRDSVQQDPGLYNQISGETMVISLDREQNLSRIDVNTQAELLYHTFENETPSGVNYTSGNSIVMQFADNALQRVMAYRNVNGKQYPASMRSQSDINLPGFRIRDEEKPVL
ncbi:MAG: hypothetical protein C1942_07845 [Prosthecochloris sp.]|uniref:OstA-like protein n=1 Tax=Prosthecochloris sp. TaxID=290513 RepID=UPI0013C7A4AE|nr:OstA-like protein [Prosthecochloris sp.]NEX12584.1 hypothetical protein [Prosthecochloris sp.]